MTYGGYVYILTNRYHTVFYIGVTSDLGRRMQQHMAGTHPGFSAKYQTTKLVYYERHERIEDAIAREKYLKGKRRKVKFDLIVSQNSMWQDLAKDIPSGGGSPINDVAPHAGDPSLPLGMTAGGGPPEYRNTGKR